MWTKITDKLPEDGKDYLVWTGHYHVVGTAHFYTKEQRMEFAGWVTNTPPYMELTKEMENHYLNCAGYFAGEMDKHYFDNSEVHYMELWISPVALAEQARQQKEWEESLVSKNIYLRKDDQIIGLHAIGEGDVPVDVVDANGKVLTTRMEFHAIEQWGNEYDNEHNMLGRGSFRVFQSIESLAEEMTLEGWEVFEGPKKKEQV